MNRPKITKQTLKELRGELMAKQNAQKHFKQEYTETLFKEKQKAFNDEECGNKNQTEFDFEEEMKME